MCKEIEHLYKFFYQVDMQILYMIYVHISMTDIIVQCNNKKFQIELLRITNKKIILYSSSFYISFANTKIYSIYFCFQNRSIIVVEQQGSLFLEFISKMKLGDFADLISEQP